MGELALLIEARRVNRETDRRDDDGDNDYLVELWLPDGPTAQPAQQVVWPKDEERVVVGPWLCGGRRTGGGGGRSRILGSMRSSRACRGGGGVRVRVDAVTDGLVPLRSISLLATIALGA